MYTVSHYLLQNIITLLNEKVYIFCDINIITAY